MLTPLFVEENSNINYSNFIKKELESFPLYVYQPSPDVLPIGFLTYFDNTVKITRTKYTYVIQSKRIYPLDYFFNFVTYHRDYLQLKTREILDPIEQVFEGKSTLSHFKQSYLPSNFYFEIFDYNTCVIFFKDLSITNNNNGNGDFKSEWGSKRSCSHACVSCIEQLKDDFNV